MKKIIPKKTIDSYLEDGLVQVYIHTLPKWMRILIFLKGGTFNGSIPPWSWRSLTRISCYFNKHKWGVFKYGVNPDKEYLLQCKRCGISSKKVCLNGEETNH